MPIEDILSYKLICKGGLESNDNILDLSDNYPGFATELQNFEPSLFGGYRRINGYEPLEASYPEITNGGDASGKILGVAIYNEDIYAFRANLANTAYNIFRRSAGADWVNVAGMPARSILSGGQTVNKIRYVTFNFNGTEKIIFVDGVNVPLMYDGTTFDTITVGGTGADYANAGGAMALTNPKYITIFRDHIFMAGDSTVPHIVAHSAPSEEFDWTAAGGAGQINAGFVVNQIKPFRDENYVFGNTRLRRVIVSGTDFVIEDVAQNIGCIASDSVVEISSDLLFLSQDGFRTVAGTEKIGDIELGAISKNIQQDVTELIQSQANLTHVDAVVVRRKSQYRIFFNDSTIDAEDTEGILGGLKGDQNGLHWEWAKTLGIRTSCSTSDYIDNVEYVIHGDYNGKVYRQEQGNHFDSRNIHAIYATPFLDFGDTQVRKTFKYINVFLRPEGAVTLDTAVRFDWDNYGTINPNNYTLTSVGTPPVWGSVNWGSFNYGNSGTIPVNTSPIEGSAFAIQVEFSTDDISAPYSIQGVVIEYTPNGRK